MEESRGVYTLPVLYNEQSGTNEGVCVRKELGVVVAIDKVDGDIIFDYVEVTIGKMYGGYVYIVHYNFASTAS